MASVRHNKMKQVTGRRLALIRAVGVCLLIVSIRTIVDGHATGAFEVGTRRSSIFLSGQDIWLGYLFWVIGVFVSLSLCFIHLAHTSTFRLLTKWVGVAFVVTLGLCFLKGAHVL